MASDATRDSLLDAAKRVCQRDGAGNLTLDAVAKEAGVSKGGLLYHFPSKSDLLRGMIAQGMRYEEEAMAEEIGPNPARGAFARHYLRNAMLKPKMCDEGKDFRPPREMVWSMMSAVANDPTLLQPVRDQQGRWQRRLEEEVGDPDVATIIRLMGHGLWSTELFGFDVPGAAQRERILEILCRMAGLDDMETR